MKLAGYNHHQHHKLSQPRSRVKDTINNGIQSFAKLRDTISGVAHLHLPILALA